MDVTTQKIQGPETQRPSRRSGVEGKPMLFVTRLRARCPFMCRFRLFVSVARRVHRETTRECLMAHFAGAAIGLSRLSDPQKRGHRLVGSLLEMMIVPVVKALCTRFT